MMFTFAMISCNRKHYIKNSIDSVLRFVDLDRIKILVIDNGSTEEGMDEYLNSLPEFIEVKKYEDRCPNELHRAMNYGIKVARRNGSKYINFIQDDYQYVHNDPYMLDNVHAAFEAHQDVVQLQTNMIWKKKFNKIGSVDIVKVGKHKWFKMLDKAPCDNGFTRVDLYDRIGLYPVGVSIHGKEKGYVSGEAWFAKKTRGTYRMISAYPNMSMIKNCAYVRGNKRHGDYFPPPESLYLRPTTEEEVKHIKVRGRSNSFCFIEDMTRTWGWEPKTADKHSQSDKVEPV